jgi:uncharacterized protein (TIGR02265 family)
MTNSNTDGYFIKKEAIIALLVGTNLQKDETLAAQILEETGQEYDVSQPPDQLSLPAARRILELVAARILPETAQREAMWELGRLAFEGYRKTPVGKILLAAIDVWGATRLIRNSPQVYKAAFKYGERIVREIEPKRWELFYYDEPGYIEFLAGVTQAAVEASGAQNVALAIQPLNSENARQNYRIEINWD